jgi:threonine/homoserine/homoserine lactone efflux protein
LGLHLWIIEYDCIKVNLKEGKRNAIWFVLGAIIIIFSSFVAILFARVINVRPDIIILLREVGFAFFWCIDSFFYGSPKCLNLKAKSRSQVKKRFF